jgi:hypothetical protein
MMKILLLMKEYTGLHIDIVNFIEACSESNQGFLNVSIKVRVLHV